MTEHKQRKRPSFNNLDIKKEDVKKENINKEESKPFTLTQPKVAFFENEVPKENTLSDLLKADLSEEDSESVNETMTLSDLLNDVKDVIEETLDSNIWITAEIAKLKQQGKNGHIYLELIDRDSSGTEISKINAMIWSSNAAKLLSKFEKNTNEKLKDGIKCEWFVRLNYNIKYGLSLTISDIKPLWSIGEHEKKKEAIRQKLQKEGIWWNQKDVNAPKVITSIAVIAPNEAAGLGDFMSESNKWKKSNLVKVDIFNAVFEGDKTSSSVSHAFKEIKKKSKEYYEENKESLYDVVIILRGGGAKTSLAWLDEYEIVQNMLLMNIPVWSAIGHEQDSGLLDEVSSMSYHTPSKAAQKIWEGMQNEYYDFNQVFMKILSEKESRCKSLEHNIKNNFDNIIYEAYKRIDFLKNRTSELSREAITLGPRSTLERGYTIIKDSKGNVIKRSSEIENEEEITIQFFDKDKQLKIRKE